MTQVSRRFLRKEVEDRILDLFWTSLSQLSTKRDIATLLDDLLSSTEKIMLFKRLTIAFMLIKGYDYQTINDRLKVSNPTIWQVNLSLKHKGKGYKTAISKIMSKEKWEAFWDDLDHFLEQLISPRPGTNWKEVRRKQWEKRRKKLQSRDLL